MDNNNIKYVLFGDAPAQTMIYDSSKNLAELLKLRKESMSLFERVSNSLKSEEVNKMPGQEGNFYFLFKNDIFHLVCTNKNYQDKKAIGLLEELIAGEFGKKIQNRVEIIEKDEYEKVIEKLNDLINKYDLEKEQPAQNYSQSEYEPIKLDNKTVQHLLTEENQNEKRVVNVKNVFIEVNPGVKAVTINDEENEKIKKALKWRNCKLALILTFLSIGIILAIILPIVLQ